MDKRQFTEPIINYGVKPAIELAGVVAITYHGGRWAVGEVYELVKAEPAKAHVECVEQMPEPYSAMKTQVGEGCDIDRVLSRIKPAKQTAEPSASAEANQQTWIDVNGELFYRDANRAPTKTEALTQAKSNLNAITDNKGAVQHESGVALAVVGSLALAAVKIKSSRSKGDHAQKDGPGLLKKFTNHIGWTHDKNQPHSEAEIREFEAQKA